MTYPDDDYAEDGLCVHHGQPKPCLFGCTTAPPVEPPAEIVIHLDRVHVLRREGSSDGTSHRYVCSDCNCGVEAWIDWRRR